MSPAAAATVSVPLPTAELLHHANGLVRPAAGLRDLDVVGRALAELDAERVRAAAQLARDVVGAVLGGQLVVRVAGREHLVGELGAVELRLEEPEPAHVQARACAMASVEREAAREDRQRLRVRAPGELDPLRRAPVGLLEQARLERRRRAPRRRLRRWRPTREPARRRAGATAAGPRRRRRRTGLRDATLPDCHRYGPGAELASVAATRTS